MLCATRAGRCLKKPVDKNNRGRWNLAIPAPSFNCAAKFLRLPGSIWRDFKLNLKAWQEVFEQIAVQICACLCKRKVTTLENKRQENAAKHREKKTSRKNRGRVNLSILAPSFNCAAKFLGSPAQSVVTLRLAEKPDKRSRHDLLCKSVQICAKDQAFIITVCACGLSQSERESASFLKGRVWRCHASELPWDASVGKDPAFRHPAT
jgi:hypothetical protein